MEATCLNRIHVMHRHELPPAERLPSFYRDLRIKLVLELARDGDSIPGNDLVLRQEPPIPYVFLTLGPDLARSASIIFQTLIQTLGKRPSNVLILVNDPEVAGLGLLCYLLYDKYFSLGFSEARAILHATYPFKIYVPFSSFLDFSGPPFNRPVTDVLNLPQ